MFLETLTSDPDSVQRALPQQGEGFLVFFGSGVGRSAAWGPPHHRALGYHRRPPTRTRAAARWPAPGFYLSAYARQPGAHVEVIGIELLWLLRLSALLLLFWLLCVVWGLGFQVCGSWFVVNGLGLYGPILGLCWPILAHLGAMLAYLEGNLGPS